MFIELIYTDGDVSKPIREDIVNIFKKAKKADIALKHLSWYDATILLEAMKNETDDRGSSRDEAYLAVRGTVLGHNIRYGDKK